MTATAFRVVATWHLPNTSAPHDFAATAAVPELTGAAERMLALLVGETRPAGMPSRLLQYVLVPEGGDLAVMEEHAVAVHAAAAAAEGPSVGAPAPMPGAPAPAPAILLHAAGPGAIAVISERVVDDVFAVWSNLTSFSMAGGGGGVVGIVIGGMCT